MLLRKENHAHKVESLYATTVYADESNNLPVVSKVLRSTLQPGYVREESVSATHERTYWVINGELAFNDNGEETNLYRFDSALIAQGERCSFRNNSHFPVDLMEFELLLDE